MHHASADVEETAVDRIIGPGNKRSLVRAQEQREGGHFLRLGHSANGLGAGELFQHLLLVPGIILFHKLVNKRRKDARRRNAIAPNVIAYVIFRHRERHREHRAFAHGVGETIGKPGRSRDGRQVQDHAVAVFFHFFDAGEHAVVNALHVHAEDAVEVFFGGIFQLPDMGNAGAVHQDFNGPFLPDLIEGGLDALALGDITTISGRYAAGFRDLCGNCLGERFIQVNNIDACAVRGKSLGNGAANATGAPGDGSYSAFKPECSVAVRVLFQRETPLFHGIKSSCPSCSALVCSSPLATLTTSSIMASPICSTVFSPEMTGPVSISIMSGMRCASLELVETLTTGAMGLPVGVPNPVVKSTTLEPEPTLPVTASTSLPGVHSRFKPGSVAYSG